MDELWTSMDSTFCKLVIATEGSASLSFLALSEPKLRTQEHPLETLDLRRLRCDPDEPVDHLLVHDSRAEIHIAIPEPLQREKSEAS